MASRTTGRPIRVVSSNVSSLPFELPLPMLLRNTQRLSRIGISPTTEPEMKGPGSCSCDQLTRDTTNRYQAKLAPTAATADIPIETAMGQPRKLTIASATGNAPKPPPAPAARVATSGLGASDPTAPNPRLIIALQIPSARPAIKPTASTGPAAIPASWPPFPFPAAITATSTTEVARDMATAPTTTAPAAPNLPDLVGPVSGPIC